MGEKAGAIRELGMNIAVALFYALFVCSLGNAFLTAARLSTLLLLIKETLDILFVLYRRIPKHVSSDFAAWAIAIGGTIAPLLLRPSGATDKILGAILQCSGVFLQIISMASINRSFGIVPANRGIKKGGMYRIVRHPLYASYALSIIGFMISHYSPMNIAVIFLAVILQISRVYKEEELLSLDMEYQQYVKETKWRMIPFIF